MYAVHVIFSCPLWLTSAHSLQWFKFIQEEGLQKENIPPTKPFLSSYTIPCNAGLWDAVSILQNIDADFQVCYSGRFVCADAASDQTSPQECVNMLVNVNPKLRAEITDVLSCPYLNAKLDMPGYISEMKDRKLEIERSKHQEDAPFSSRAASFESMLWSDTTVLAFPTCLQEPCLLTAGPSS